MCKELRVLCGLAFVALFAAGIPAANAQSSNQGAIVGTVTDTTGGTVPGAEVTATNPATGVTRRVLTSERGDYRLDFLPPGRYEIAVSLVGFKKVEIADLTLEVGQELRADARLEIGEITESVRVTGTSAVVDSETAALGEVVDERKIQNLPLNGREFLSLAGLVPGAQAGLNRRGQFTSKGFEVSFNGARSVQNSFNVDGADSVDSWGNQLISSPVLDAIQEFRVSTNMYSAQYGRSGGAVVDVLTKSGTNDFHGSLYWYHRNKPLDALPYFFKGTKESQPPYLYNQLGASVGGPIIKNKTFFFLATEFYRQKKAGQQFVSFAPTAKERVGDLTDTINPYTLKPVEIRNPFTGEPIPDKKVPANLMNPVGKKFMDLWPEPNFDDPFLNLRFFRAGSNKRAKWTARVDHNFNENNILTGTFNLGDYDDVSPYYTKFGDTAVYEHDRMWSTTYTRVWSPSLINDIKFSYIWFNSGNDQVMVDKIYSQEWGMWLGSVTKKPGVPRLLFYTIGWNRFDISTAGGIPRENRNVFLKDTLSWTKGSHTLSVGGDYKRNGWNWVNGQTRPDGFHYFGQGDGHPLYDSKFGATGSTFSSVLMAVPGEQRFGRGDGSLLNLMRNIFAVWIEDEWKVTPRLTLNLGLRYDYLPAFSETDGKVATINESSGLLIYGKGAPAEALATLKYPFETGGPKQVYPADKNDLGPRIGFAFRPFRDNKTAVRGGYGVFYGVDTAFQTAWQTDQEPWSGGYYYSGRASYMGWKDGQDHFTSLDQKPYNYDVLGGTRPAGGEIVLSKYPTTYFSQWNLSVERELIPRMALEVAYVGSKGTQVNGRESLDALGALASEIRQNYPGWNPAFHVKGYNSKYHALQLKLKKDFSHGLNFLTSYSWGHAMAESSQDAYNDNLRYSYSSQGSKRIRDYSNADFDLRHQFSFSGGYELPWGQGKPFGTQWNRWLDGALGGWQLHYILTLQGGYPFGVRTTSNLIPNRIADGNLPASERTAGRWFDYTAFVPKEPVQVVLPDGTVITDNNGNAGANIIRGPGINNLDLGIHKGFTITERVRTQLRFEMFNVLNHPNFLGPSQYAFTSATGAQLTQAREMRDIQIALKILF